MAEIYIDNVLCGKVSNEVVIGIEYVVSCNYGDYGITGSSVKIVKAVSAASYDHTLEFASIKVEGVQVSSIANDRMPQDVISVDVNDAGKVLVVNSQGYVFMKNSDGPLWYV